MNWLLGNLQPDHKTISDFRKDNIESIRTVTLSFRKFFVSNVMVIYRQSSSNRLYKGKSLYK
jgi:hypothetical protein